MARHRTTFAFKLKKYFRDNPEQARIYRLENGGSELFCKACRKQYCFKRLYQLRQHERTELHITSVNELAEEEAGRDTVTGSSSLFPLETATAALQSSSWDSEPIVLGQVEGGDIHQDELFSEELCNAFAAADIPFGKLDNPVLHEFFRKWCRRKLPGHSQLQEDVPRAHVSSDNISGTGVQVEGETPKESSDDFPCKFRFCLICVSPISFEEGKSSEVSQATFLQGISIVCGILGVEDRFGKAEEWTRVVGSAQFASSVCCQNCFVLLKNLVELHELMLMTEISLKEKTHQVEMSIVNSSRLAADSEYSISTCIQFREEISNNYKDKITLPRKQRRKRPKDRVIPIPRISFSKKSAHKTVNKKMNKTQDELKEDALRRMPSVRLEKLGDTSQLKAFNASCQISGSDSGLNVNLKRERDDDNADDDDVSGWSRPSDEDEDYKPGTFSQTSRPKRKRGRKPGTRKRLKSKSSDFNDSNSDAGGFDSSSEKDEGMRSGFEDDDDYEPPPMSEGEQLSESDGGEVEEVEVFSKVRSTTRQPRTSIKFSPARRINGNIDRRVKVDDDKRRTCKIVEKLLREDYPAYIRPFLVIDESNGILSFSQCRVVMEANRLVCQHPNCYFEAPYEHFQYYYAFQMIRFHMRMEHRRDKDPQADQEKIFCCVYCSEQFERRYSLYQHIKANHKDAEPFLSLCEVCGDSMPQEDLLAHIFSHKSEEERKVAESMLAGSFKVRKGGRVKNPTYPLQFPCDKCETIVESFSELRSHAQSHIPKDVRRQFQCDQCADKFTSLVCLRNHIRFVHNRAEQPCYECRICGKKYLKVKKSLYENHLRMHTGETPFQCQHCGRKFSMKRHLKLHQAVHQNAQLQCEYCSNVYKSERYLRRHHYKHHSDIVQKPSLKRTMPDPSNFIGPKLAYPCEPCGRVYTYKSQLVPHLRHAHKMYFPNSSDYPNMLTFEDQVAVSNSRNRKGKVEASSSRNQYSNQHFDSFKEDDSMSEVHSI